MAAVSAALETDQGAVHDEHVNLVKEVYRAGLLKRIEKGGAVPDELLYRYTQSPE